MSTEAYKICFCLRRRFRLAPAEPPAEIKRLFERYSKNGYISVDNLRRFLLEIQKEQNATIKDAQTILNSLGRHLSGLHLEAFFKYLFGETNPPINPTLGVHHDMTSPLSHYFIYTGHNSYLTGNQLSSNCSDVPIINALHRGVRVIDLEIWPNSTKDDVIVLNGGTLTTPVQLIKCLRSIKEHAFSASEFPVVITLEDHLTVDLQAKVSQMIYEIFGDLLFVPRPEVLKEFPSPESLKRRIIIAANYLEEKKVKKGKVFKLEVAWGQEVRYSIAGIDDDKDKEDTEDDEVYPRSKEIQEQEYRRLIAIRIGKGKDGLDNSLKIDSNKVTCLSLSELELEKASETLAKDIMRFTQRNLLRVYPKQTRITSSNYDPLVWWIHGAQMVAFNMQGFGRSLWLMHGMFRANGGCGYVKKPNILLDHNEIFDPNALPVKTTLMVTVYMGDGWHLDLSLTHFDIYSPPDFYARVGIAGVPNDTIIKKTKVVEDHWIPTWNEEFEFPLTVPELALLRVEVHEYDMSDKDDLGGQTCLPVSELREGIRAIPLHSYKGEKYNFIKLLMRFEFV